MNTMRERCITLSFLQNIVTAAQTTITAVQSVLIVANQVLELEALDEILVAEGIAEDMAALGEIVSQATGLSYDLGQLHAQVTALFSLDSAPRTREGLDERLVEIRRVVYESRTFALRTQTLLMTVLRTVAHLTALMQSIGAFVGNKTGQQTMTQVQGNISQTLAVMEAQQATFQRVDVVERLSKDVIIESLHRIDERRWESWPRP